MRNEEHVEIHVVDAFTSKPFGGNPAAVVLLGRDDRDVPEAWMQQLAAEMRHSETAYVRERADGSYDLRWFTPATEVDLCGHATLASAYALNRPGTTTFHTRSGALHATATDEGIELDFPAVHAEPGPPPAGLLAGLGLTTAVATAQSDFYAVVEVADAKTVRTLSPDFLALADVDTRATLVMAPGDEGYDVVSRVFGPRVGIPEDPVTGSAHCVIATWWCERLGKPTLRAYQASARGGEVDVTLNGDRVLLRGKCATVIRGELHANPGFE